MRRRIDMTEVETATKIRGKYLRALENEEWDLLPGPTFVKSFLRTYAEYLGLDARLLVEEYRQRYERPSTQDLTPFSARRTPKRRRRGRLASLGPVLVIGGLVVLLLGVLWLLGTIGQDDETPAPPNQASQTPTPTPAKKKSKSNSPRARAPARGPVAPRRHGAGLRLPRRRATASRSSTSRPWRPGRGRPCIRAACSGRTSAMTTCGCWSTASRTRSRPAPTRSATSCGRAATRAGCRTPRGRTARRERPRRDRRNRHRGALGHHPRRERPVALGAAARPRGDVVGRDRRRRPAGRSPRFAGLPRRPGDGPDHHQRRARADGGRSHRRGRRRIRRPPARRRSRCRGACVGDRGADAGALARCERGRDEGGRAQAGARPCGRCGAGARRNRSRPGRARRRCPAGVGPSGAAGRAPADVGRRAADRAVASAARPRGRARAADHAGHRCAGVRARAAAARGAARSRPPRDHDVPPPRRARDRDGVRARRGYRLCVPGVCCRRSLRRPGVLARRVDGRRDRRRVVARAAGDDRRRRPSRAPAG